MAWISTMRHLVGNGLVYGAADIEEQTESKDFWEKIFSKTN